MSPLANRPGRLKIGVVGAGRVGAVLAHALRGCGHEVTAVSGASAESRERIEVLLPGVPIVDPDDALTGNDLVLLTVPDDVLAEVVTGFAKLGLFAAGQIVVHTQATGWTFCPGNRAGRDSTGPPAMTFTGTSVTSAGWRGAIAITAGPAMLLTAHSVKWRRADRAAGRGTEVHHAACARANHLVTLVSQARRILERAECKKPGSSSPSSARIGRRWYRDYALTGPIRRGDVGTIAAHVEALPAPTPRSC